MLLFPVPDFSLFNYLLSSCPEFIASTAQPKRNNNTNNKIRIKKDTKTILYIHSELIFNFVFSLRFFIAAPPSNIEIQGYGPNSKVEVRENQDLTLTCIVSDAKPAAQIQWFRNNVEMKTGNTLITLNSIETVECMRSAHTANVQSAMRCDCFVEWCHIPCDTTYWIGNNIWKCWILFSFCIPTDRRDDKVIESNKRFTTTSRLQLSPTPEEDYVEYSCQAKHKALQPDMPMRATVQLSVLCKYFVHRMQCVDEYHAQISCEKNDLQQSCVFDMSVSSRWHCISCILMNKTLSDGPNHMHCIMCTMILSCILHFLPQKPIHLCYIWKETLIEMSQYVNAFTASHMQMAFISNQALATMEWDERRMQSRKSYHQRMPCECIPIKNAWKEIKTINIFDKRMCEMEYFFLRTKTSTLNYSTTKGDSEKSQMIPARSNGKMDEFSNTIHMP